MQKSSSKGLSKHKNLIAIDYGTKKSGIAYAKEGFVFPYKTVLTKNLIQTLEILIKEKAIESIILGMPYNIDGSMSAHARNVEKFREVLEKHTPLPIILYDERLSTAEASFAIDEFDYGGDIDTESARIILINFLEGK